MTAIALRLAMLVLLPLQLLPAQQLRWQVPASAPSTIEYSWMATFGDYDHDGYRDFLRYVDAPGPRTQIASGLDGSTLWDVAWSPSGARACYAGDMDGDGEPDIAVVGAFTSATRSVFAYSPRRNLELWRVTGTFSAGFGHSLVGNLDVDGDGRPDVLATNFSNSAGDVFAYNNKGSLLYRIPCLALGRYPVSLAGMGDVDGDGADDFVVGCIEPTSHGLQWLISGRFGTTIRETYGPLPGDNLALTVTNLGDIDGDGINDYAAFPWYTAQRTIGVAYSGGTGAVIRSWDDAPNSTIAGEDFDQDGVPDLVTGSDWAVNPPNDWGRTICWSGRDGRELWRVDVVPNPLGSNGTSGWMNWSANLGVQPGSPYPVVAWLDTGWWQVGTYHGRTRAFGGARAGQGPVTGTACTSSGTLPLIGVRKLGVDAANTGSRITVAKTHSNALAALTFASTALSTPVDLSSFGFAGCTVYLDPAASALTMTGTTGIDRGYAFVDLPHPLAAAAVGTNVVAQWLVYDPATLAYAATQMHALKLQ